MVNLRDVFQSPEFYQNIQTGLGGLGEGLANRELLKIQEDQKLRSANRDLFVDLVSKGLLKEDAVVPPELQPLAETAKSFQLTPESERETKDVYFAGKDTLEKIGTVGKEDVVFKAPPDLQDYIKKNELNTTKDLKKDYFKTIDDTVTVLDRLNILETKSKTLQEFNPGVWEQIKAKTSFAAKEFAQDPEVAEYIAAIDGSLALFARKIMSERGVLTNQDVERARAMLGNKTAPLTTKLNLINELRESALQRIQIKQELADISDQYIQLQSPTFFDILQKNRSQLKKKKGENTITLPSGIKIKGTFKVREK